MHDALKKRIDLNMRFLNERQLRCYLASEAKTYGYGGITLVSRLSGKARSTITKGMKELNSEENGAAVAEVRSGRIRKAGGGRKSIKSKTPEIKGAISKIVESSTFGNPENVLFYTTMSMRKIQLILNNDGYTIGYNVVGTFLKELGYSLQKNQKMLQVGDPHPDRNRQFEFIKSKSQSFSESGDPVISIDAKKKELIGNFKNPGETYRKSKDPVKVYDHDFPLKDLGKVTPYGVYDIGKNMGFVNLGISKDTPEFAVESISRWWLNVGKNTYPKTSRIYINCDAGGSNGYRSRMFKSQLQEFANQSGLEVHVSHLPPGASKWNKIEHRLFCYIASHWRGQPLISVETVVDLIGSTTTTKGLQVVCIRDDNVYQIGQKVSQEDFEAIRIKHEEICPNWNYVISPTS